MAYCSNVDTENSKLEIGLETNKDKEEDKEEDKEWMRSYIRSYHAFMRYEACMMYQGAVTIQKWRRGKVARQRISLRCGCHDKSREE